MTDDLAGYPPPRPEDRVRAPGEGDPTERRAIGIALFVVAEISLFVVLVWGAWGGADDDRPALGLGEGITTIITFGAIPTVLFVAGALVVGTGRAGASAIAGGLLVALGAIAGFVAMALTLLTRIETQEH